MTGGECRGRTRAACPFRFSSVHRAACDVTDPWPVPRRVEIILHVGVVGEELAIEVETAVENVSVARRNDLPVLSVGGHLVNDSRGSKSAAVVALSVGHPGKKMVFSPMSGNARGLGFRRSGVVSGDQVNRFLVRAENQGMYAVVTPGLHAPELFNLVQLVVPIRIGKFVNAAFHLSFS